MTELDHDEHLDCAHGHTVLAPCDRPGETASRRSAIVRLVQEEVEALFERLEEQPERLDAAMDELFAELGGLRYGPY